MVLSGHAAWSDKSARAHCLLTACSLPAGWVANDAALNRSTSPILPQVELLPWLLDLRLRARYEYLAVHDAANGNTHAAADASHHSGHVASAGVMVSFWLQAGWVGRTQFKMVLYDSCEASRDTQRQWDVRCA